MARNIKDQLRYCARNSEAYGQSKHIDKSMKEGVRHDGRTYSYNSMNSRMDTAKQFGKWMGVAHPEVKYAAEINADHINEWLETKAEKSAKATLESYASNMRTLIKQVEKTYHVNLECKSKDILTPITMKDPLRTKAFTDDDLNKLQKSFKVDSVGYRAINLEKATGCRVEGLTKLVPEDITIYAKEFATVFVHGEKGGRERTVDVFGEENVRNLMHIKEITPLGQRICPLHPDSLNKSFRRHMNMLKLNYDRTTTHAMRKNWAQHRYDEYRKTHSKYDTIRYINVQLGHGAEREVELLGHYVANIH